MRLPRTLLFPLCISVFSVIVVPLSSAQSVARRASTETLSAIPSPPRASVTAVRATGHITIDGLIDEPQWAAAPVINSFTQDEPDEGHPPTERTEVRILFDDEAVYIGAMMFDSAPDSIVARLGRRDSDLDSDAFGFYVDPYLDRRSGYYFAVNAAGSLMDGVLQNDTWDDDSWDGVWQARVHRGANGWSAEMRIPYSQLRFREKQSYTWGVNFRREISRRNETNMLVITPREETGFVSKFADLTGISDISPPRQIEATPYVLSRAAYTDAATGDPFNDGSTYAADFGADFKIGLSSNTTLNATVNPDFGQVEVDPAVVNLSDYETFFPEKRPFFVEGSTIFDFGSGGSNSFWGFNWGGADLFYSRRIGRAPQGSLPSAEFADVPDGSRILGAAKLTGRVLDGWDIGAIQAVTGRSNADIANAGAVSRVEVEPLTYYGVVRGRKEYNDGYRSIGFLSTTAVRRFEDDRLRSEINSGAYTGSVDGWSFLGSDRMWVVTGWASLSHVTGTTERMVNLQRSSQHYFQMPDSRNLTVDSSATSLSGFAGRLMLNKQSGSWRNNTAVAVMTPGYEINDLGFQSRANLINAHTVFTFRWSQPSGIFRYRQINTAAFYTRDFDGNTTGIGIFSYGSVRFTNYFSIQAGGSMSPQRTSIRRTRGGPKTKEPAAYEIFGGMESDSRKKVVFEMDGSAYGSREERQVSLSPSVQFKPASNLSISVGPGFSNNQSVAQWVGRFDDPLATATFGSRYVFAEIDQKTVSGNIRMNWTFSPALSLQLYAQPLISSGSYTNFKELRRPNSFDFLTYGEEGSTFDEATYTVDPDGSGPAEAFSLSNPDFNFKSLRGTAVLRWEYRQGSTLYFVWTQTRDDYENDGTFDFAPSFDRLINAKADNIFVVKLTWWLSR